MLTSQQIHWAAGFMDGEGYFSLSTSRTLRVNAVQKDPWPVKKMQSMFGGRLSQQRRDRAHPDALYWVWECYGRRAAGVMMTLYVLLSPRRQERIRSALAVWKAKSYHNIGRYNRDKTHCKRGHEFTLENTYAKDGKYRQCRTCQRVNALRWYHEQKV